MCKSRGIANNNPGNIRKSNIAYKGEVPSNDIAFKQFRSMGWGYRAVFVLLRTYQVRYKLNTIRQFMERYAPPSENNTEGYLNFVCRYAEVDENQPIDTLDGKIMIRIAQAISKMENGTSPQLCEVLEGWTLFEKYPVG